MNEPEEQIMICGSADAELVATGTTFTHRCSRCGKIVAMAPSGQRFLVENPSVIIICVPCLMSDESMMKSITDIGFTAPPGEIKAEFASLMPNLRRNRN